MSRCLCVVPAVWLLLVLPAASSAETVAVDGHSPGRTFEGLGGLSAGAGTRLLFDYPEPQRSQVLDLLFRPNFGAAMQHLKVEIGGDVNSSTGIEQSFARTRQEFDHPRPEFFNRGYEWWLMREAKRRNPRIFIDVLQWGAPDWVGDKDFPDFGDSNHLLWDDRMSRNYRKFYTQDDADYVVRFIQGAKTYHGVDVDFCGIWNETLFDVPWIKLLRKTLDHRGLSRVKVVAADEVYPWNIAEAVAGDGELKKALYALGAHYSGTQTTETARRSGMPLWASEDHAGWTAPDWREACALARLYNRNYINGRMTKTVICFLICSYYETVAYPNAATITANTPWSGQYHVWPAIWAVAHTTQFVQPGWQYLDGACRALDSGGSCVAMRDPSPTGDFSIIVETADAKKPQTLSFHPSGGLSAGPVHVWRSSRQSQFERRDDLLLADGALTIVVEPGCIYSLTTTTGQNKGQTQIPPAADFPFPYREDFESGQPSQMPKYFSDQAGVFEVAQRPDGGKCLRQMLTRRGIDWHFHPNPNPHTVVGSTRWRDYEVICDVNVEKAGYAALFGRISATPQTAEPPKGYWLKASTDGHWELKAFTQTLASGNVPFAADRWHKLAMTFRGRRIAASVDGVEVKAVEDGAFSAGMAGLGSGWNRALFDNFFVRPVSR